MAMLWRMRFVLLGAIAGVALHAIYFGATLLAQSAGATVSQPKGGYEKSGSKTLPPDPDAPPGTPPSPVLPAFRHNDSVDPVGNPTPKTLAQVGYGVIGFPQYDTAEARDPRRIVGEVASIPGGSNVDWWVDFEFHNSAKAIPINAPGVPDPSSSYKAHAFTEVDVKFRILTAQNKALKPVREFAPAMKRFEALRENDDATPHEFNNTTYTQGDVQPGASHLELRLEGHTNKASLWIAVKASVYLQSLREGVSVGGSAKVELVSGKMAAYKNGVLMKRADGQTDAEWPLQ